MKNCHTVQFNSNPYDEGLSNMLDEMFCHSHIESQSLTVFYKKDDSITEAMFKCGCNEVINLISWKTRGSMYMATQADFDPERPFKNGLKGFGRDAKEALKDLCDQIELEYCNQNNHD